MSAAARRSHLDVFSPECDYFASVELARDAVTVGRLPEPDEAEPPDVALPDATHVISRIHCRLVRERGAWWVVDTDSRNGTYVRRAGGDVVRVPARAQLDDG